MSDFREDLLTRMIHIYGFENEVVIQFAYLCARYDDTEWNNQALEILVRCHEAEPCLAE